MIDELLKIREVMAKLDNKKHYLYPEEERKMWNWAQEHYEVEKMSCYSFDIEQTSASGIGTNTFVICSCGERVDITDYFSW